MSSNNEEPIKSKELTAKLEEALKKRPEVIEIREDTVLDFQVKIKDYSEPVFFGMQSDVRTMPEIGYYQLVAFVGSSDMLKAKSSTFQMGKTVEKAVDSFFKDFNTKKK